MAGRRYREHASGLRLPLLGGVELLAATFVTHSFSRHFHERYALGVIERGAMRFRYLGSNQVASRGLVNLVVPGEVHDGHAATPEGWTYRMFYLKPEAVATALGLGPDARALPHFRQGVIRDPHLAARVKATHTLAADPRAPDLAKETALIGLIRAWVEGHAGEKRLARPKRPEPAKAARAARTIRERCRENLGLEELAGEAGLSPYHLVHVFTEAYGLPPHAYLMDCRVRFARDLLSGQARLADVAQECGFADQSHLTRLFKRRFGLTPGAYRKIVQNT